MGWDGGGSGKRQSDPHPDDRNLEIATSNACATIAFFYRDLGDGDRAIQS